MSDDGARDVKTSPLALPGQHAQGHTHAHHDHRRRDLGLKPLHDEDSSTSDEGDAGCNAPELAMSTSSAHTTKASPGMGPAPLLARLFTKDGYPHPEHEVTSQTSPGADAAVASPLCGGFASPMLPRCAAHAYPGHIDTAVYRDVAHAHRASPTASSTKESPTLSQRGGVSAWRPVQSGGGSPPHPQGQVGQQQLRRDSCGASLRSSGAFALSDDGGADTPQPPAGGAAATSSPSTAASSLHARTAPISESRSPVTLGPRERLDTVPQSLSPFVLCEETGSPSPSVGVGGGASYHTTIAVDSPTGSAGMAIDIDTPRSGSTCRQSGGAPSPTGSPRQVADNPLVSCRREVAGKNANADQSDEEAEDDVSEFCRKSTLPPPPKDADDSLSCPSNYENPSKSSCSEDPAGCVRIVITPTVDQCGLSDTQGTRGSARMSGGSSRRDNSNSNLPPTMSNDSGNEFGRWVASAEGSPRSAPATPGPDLQQSGMGVTPTANNAEFAPIRLESERRPTQMLARMSGSGRCVSVEIPVTQAQPTQATLSPSAKPAAIRNLSSTVRNSFRSTFLIRGNSNPNVVTAAGGSGPAPPPPLAATPAPEQFRADSSLFDEPVSPTSVIVLGKVKNKPADKEKEKDKDKAQVNGGGGGGGSGGGGAPATGQETPVSKIEPAFSAVNSDRQDSWQVTSGRNSVCGDAASLGGASAAVGMSGGEPLVSQRRRSKFKSIDYDDMTAVIPSTQRLYRAVFAVYPWAIALLIAVTVAVVTYLITVGVKHLSEWKMELFYWAFSKYGLGTAYLLLVPLWLGLASVATFGVYHAPFAAGSGIPQVKAFLNGVDIPGSLELSTFLAKVIGITACLGIGFPAGREGGTVHIGACIGAGLSKGYSKRMCCNFDWLGESMSALNIANRQEKKRHFVTLGAACGVASAFGAPIGGILFVIEVVASYWNATLTFQTFVASCVAGYLIGILVSRSTIQDGGWVLFGVDGPRRQFSVWEIGAFALIAVGGGCFGSLFNACNFRMMKLRKRFLTTKYRKAGEALCIIFMVMTILFWLPVFFPCSPVPEQLEFNKTGIATMQYNCKEGEHNEMATLVHNPAERVLHQLFSRQTAGYFQETTLLVFFVCWFIMTAVLFGTAVPAGLMIPTMTMGAAWGRLIGEWLAYYNENVDPGLYALVGAAAELGGVMRLTLSLAAILVEVTNDIDHMLPIMLALTISRAIGSITTKSIYDYVLQNMGVTHLDAELPPQIQLYKVHHVMSRDIHCLYSTATPADMQEALEKDHNAFPVVKEPGDRTFLGLVSREQLEIAYEVTKQKKHVGSFNNGESFATMNSSFNSERGFAAFGAVSLAGYSHKAPPIVLQNASLKQAYMIFRSLGLRQLVVLDKDHCLVGMVTRADLGTIPEMMERVSYMDALSNHANVHVTKEQRPVYLNTAHRRASIRDYINKQGELVDKVERGGAISPARSSRGPSPVQPTPAQPVPITAGPATLLQPPTPMGAPIPPALRGKKQS